jgi:hypothetical protein
MLKLRLMVTAKETDPEIDEATLDCGGLVFIR